MENENESATHYYSKELLAEKLREKVRRLDNETICKAFPCISWTPNKYNSNYGIYTEYPILSINKIGEFVVGWDQIDDKWKISPPTFIQCLHTYSEKPLIVFDIAIVNKKGLIKYAFEIIHKNNISDYKKQIIEWLNIPVFCVKPESIMEVNRFFIPEEINIEYSICDKIKAKDVNKKQIINNINQKKHDYNMNLDYPILPKHVKSIKEFQY